MKDLIERQAAIEVMCSACGYDCDKSEFKYNAPQNEQVILCPEHYALTQLPSAQPEIIYCKDCKYADKKPIIDGRYWCTELDGYMRYCSLAERKNDETN